MGLEPMTSSVMSVTTYALVTTVIPPAPLPTAPIHALASRRSSAGVGDDRSSRAFPESAMESTPSTLPGLALENVFSLTNSGKGTRSVKFYICRSSASSSTVAIAIEKDGQRSAR